MTPEDWQRAWQESGEAVKNPDIDVFGRGASCRNRLAQP